MLGWLCIVQSLWAYTPGVRAGAECGAAALTPLGATPLNPTYKISTFPKALCLIIICLKNSIQHNRCALSAMLGA